MSAPRLVSPPPTLGDLLEQPGRLEDVPAGEIPGLLGELEALRARLAARLTALSTAPREPEADRLLSVEETARRLSVSRDWIYRQKRLPFRVQVGPGQLRFSARGLERWIRQRQG